MISSFALSMGLLAHLTAAQVATAQDIDPLVHVPGIWFPDWASALEQCPAGENGQVDYSYLAYTGMAMQFTVLIGGDGTAALGGAPRDREFRINTKLQDDGSVLVLPDWTANPFPIIAEFKDPDTVVARPATPLPGGQPQIEFTFHRLFEQESLDEGKRNPQTESVLSGAWTVDADRVGEMPILNMLTDPAQREQVIAGLSTKPEYSFVIEPHRLTYLEDDLETLSYSVDYEIIASDEQKVLLIVDVYNHIDDDDSVHPYWRRIDIVDKNHIDLWHEGIVVPLERVDRERSQSD